MASKIFKKIRNHEFDLPPDVPNETYESFFVITMFLDDCDVPVEEEKINAAVGIYDEFRCLVALEKAVNQGMIVFNPTDEKYGLSEKGKEIRQGCGCLPDDYDIATVKNDAHDKYILAEIAKLDSKYNKLVKSVKLIPTPTQNFC